MNDLFESRGVSPMLLYESPPFDHPDYIFELKLDGARCLAYLGDGETQLINKRGKDVTAVYPELANLRRNADKRCILDGELICMRDGKPDFFALQRRSILADALKISLAAQRAPVQYVAYDILYWGGIQLTDLPLMERKRILAEHVTEGNGLSISRYVEERGNDFFELAKENGLEGIVAKKKDSRYYPGRRSRDWLKVKVMREEDYVICGYLPSENGGVKDLVLGYYDDFGRLREEGRVFFGMSRAAGEALVSFAAAHPAPSPPGFVRDPRVVWIRPELVGVVRYMMRTESGGMRHPVFKGLADDKRPEECVKRDS